MKANKILVSAIVGAMLTLGIGSTSSAVELSSDFSTLQVESQQTLSRHHHRMPPHQGNRHYDRHGGGFGHTSYGPNRGGNRCGGSYNSPRNARGGSRNVNVNVSRTEVRRVNINVNSSRRV